jgi:hypothetical protein
VFLIYVRNRCSYFELVSPVYFGYNAIWLRPPDQKVDTSAVTKASFGGDVIKRESTGVLIYKLKRKNHIESNDQSDKDNTFTKDTSSTLQLLIICRCNDKDVLSARAVFIKHNSTITWSQGELEKLYSMHSSLCGSAPIIQGTWPLDDATVLNTSSVWNDRVHTIEITVYEGTIENDFMETI